MAGYTKKYKASNFSPNEISKLKELVFKHSAVIYNKKTDSVTNRKKLEVWDRIEVEFNSSSPGLLPRTASQLKFKHGSLKRVSNTEPRKTIAVSGSRPSDISDTDTDSIIYAEKPVIKSKMESPVCVENPFIKRKMDSPLVTGSNKSTILRKKLNSLIKREVEENLDFLFFENQDLKMNVEREEELHQYHLRKAIAECKAAEAQQRSAEAQLELAKLLLKKEMDKK